MIRNDFVSNSSSTSFMIVGYCSNSEEIRDKLDELNIEYDKENDYTGDLCYLLIEKTNAELGYQAEITDDPYNFWFGMDYMDMKEDETKKEFEERILKEVQKIFPKATMKDIKYECEGGYDG